MADFESLQMTRKILATPAPQTKSELPVDDREEGGVGLLVRGGDETADPGVQWLTSKAG